MSRTCKGGQGSFKRGDSLLGGRYLVEGCGRRKCRHAVACVRRVLVVLSRVPMGALPVWQSRVSLMHDVVHPAEGGEAQRLVQAILF